MSLRNASATKQALVSRQIRSSRIVRRFFPATRASESHGRTVLNTLWQRGRYLLSFVHVWTCEGAVDLQAY